MKQVDIVQYKDSVKTHNLTAMIYCQRLTFNEGDYYPPQDGGGPFSESREYDDYLIVAAEHKPLALQRLLEDLPADFALPSEPGTDDDDRLLAALRAVAALREWRSLTSIEKWLAGKDVPFKKDRWVEID